MTTHTEQLLPFSSVAASRSPVTAGVTWGKQVRDQVSRLGARIVEILDGFANRRAAAALYEQLSKLSDTELHRRGIPRAELHRWVSGS